MAESGVQLMLTWLIFPFMVLMSHATLYQVTTPSLSCEYAKFGKAPIDRKKIIYEINGTSLSTCLYMCYMSFSCEKVSFDVHKKQCLMLLNRTTLDIKTRDGFKILKETFGNIKCTEFDGDIGLMVKRADGTYETNIAVILAEHCCVRFTNNTIFAENSLWKCVHWAGIGNSKDCLEMCRLYPHKMARKCFGFAFNYINSSCHLFLDVPDRTMKNESLQVYKKGWELHFDIRCGENMTCPGLVFSNRTTPGPTQRTTGKASETTQNPKNTKTTALLLHTLVTKPQNTKPTEPVIKHTKIPTKPTQPTLSQPSVTPATFIPDTPPATQKTTKATQPTLSQPSATPETFIPDTPPATQKTTKHPRSNATTQSTSHPLTQETSPTERQTKLPETHLFTPTTPPAKIVTTVTPTVSTSVCPPCPVCTPSMPYLTVCEIVHPVGDSMCSAVIEKGVDYTNNDITHQEHVKTVEGCCKICERTEGCHAFTFNVENQKCWLKHTVGNRQVINTATSGKMEGKCASNPCRNGGTCHYRTNGYNCTCQKGFIGENCEKTPKDCAEMKEHFPETRSGKYEFILSDKRTLKVYCDMDTLGGGWTVFQRRKDGSVNFNTDFYSYNVGFGDVSGEHWLGNDNIHLLTWLTPEDLLIELREADGAKMRGCRLSALYSDFKVGGLEHDYILLLGKFLGGAAGDSLLIHDTMKFSTKDHGDKKCGTGFHAGWWHDDCNDGLNGKFLNATFPCVEKAQSSHIAYPSAHGMHYSFSFVEMKFRSHKFSSSISKNKYHGKNHFCDQISCEMKCYGDEKCGCTPSCNVPPHKSNTMPPATPCKFGWDHLDSPRGDICYLIKNKIAVPANVARKQCAGEHATMLTIKNQIEFDFVMSMLKTNSTFPYWLGLRDEQKEDLWLWDDGETFNHYYVKFYSGEVRQPNGGRSENCAAFSPPSIDMYDLSCDKAKSYVVCQHILHPAACASIPCKNGGICSDVGDGAYACSCIPGYNGKQCETKNIDVVWSSETSHGCSAACGRRGLAAIATDMNQSTPVYVCAVHLNGYRSGWNRQKHKTCHIGDKQNEYSTYRCLCQTENLHWINSDNANCAQSCTRKYMVPVVSGNHIEAPEKSQFSSKEQFCVCSGSGDGMKLSGWSLVGHSPKMCYYDSNSGEKKSGTKSCLCQSECNAFIEKGIDFTDKDIKSKDGVKSVEECCAFCQNTKGCHVFTFHTKQNKYEPGKCWAKSGKGKKKVVGTSVISGTMPDPGACASGPCKNGGICSDLAGGDYSCSCAPGYEGDWCQIKIPNMVWSQETTADCSKACKVRGHSAFITDKNSNSDPIYICAAHTNGYRAGWSIQGQRTCNMDVYGPFDSYKCLCHTDNLHWITSANTADCGQSCHSHRLLEVNSGNHIKTPSSAPYEEFHICYGNSAGVKVSGWNLVGYHSKRCNIMKLDKSGVEYHNDKFCLCKDINCTYKDNKNFKGDSSYHTTKSVLSKEACCFICTLDQHCKGFVWHKPDHKQRNKCLLFSHSPKSTVNDRTTIMGFVTGRRR